MQTSCASQLSEIKISTLPLCVAVFKHLGHHTVMCTRDSHLFIMRRTAIIKQNVSELEFEWKSKLRHLYQNYLFIKLGYWPTQTATFHLRFCVVQLIPTECFLSNHFNSGFQSKGYPFVKLWFSELRIKQTFKLWNFKYMWFL